MEERLRYVVKERSQVYPTVGIIFDPASSKTHQELAAGTDINLLIERWKRTGEQIPVKRGEPWYGEFDQHTDLAETMNRVAEARESFLSLPVKVRAAADHDVTTFLEMLRDEAGATELVDAGLSIEGYEPPEDPPEPASSPEPEASPREPPKA